MITTSDPAVTGSARQSGRTTGHLPCPGCRLLGTLIAACMAIATAYAQSVPDKVSGEITYHQQLKQKPKGLLAAAHRSALIQQGLNGDQLDAEECALYTDHQLTAQEIAELAANGIAVAPDLWIPPIPGKHPFGFHLATVSYASLDFVRADPRFVRLETAEKANYPGNDLGKTMINADAVLNGTGVTARNGAGIKIAVADSGIDLTHGDFPVPVETYDVTDGVGVANWGTNVANTVSPHGTHVAGTALGRGTLSGGKYKGSAPGASLYFYKIGNDSTAGASTADEIEALNRAVTVGADIFTMSYGGMNYYLDGSESMEQAIDTAVLAGTTVFISAGNSADDNIHDSVSVPPATTSSSFGFSISNPSSSTSYTTAISFRINWRDGSPGNGNMVLACTNLGTGETLTQTFSGSSTRGTESKIYSLVPNIAASGSKTYTLTLQNTASSGTTPLVHCYMVSTRGTFTSPDPTYTVGSPAVADSAIAVGAWTQRKTWTDYTGGSWQFSTYTVGTLAPFSSLGPRIDGTLKPDIVTPGATTISARDSVPGLAATTSSIIDNDGLNLNGSGPANYYIMSGTSMACPMAAGAAALLLENNPALTPAQIKSAFTSTAANSGSPNNNVGYGLINVLAAINSTPPPSPPVLANMEPSVLGYTASQAATVITSSLTVTDSDSASLTGATVAIASGFINGQDVLAMSPNPQGAISASYNPSSGVLTLTGPASVSAYQGALRSITYFNSNPSPTLGARTVSFNATDGTSSSAAVTRTVNVSIANLVPVVTLPAAPVTYVENSPAVLIDATATVSDSDSPDFNSGSLTVDFSANGTTDDRLAIRHQGNGAGQIGISGNVVNFGGVAIGTFSGGTSGSTPLVVTLSSAVATPAVVQTLAQNITYQNVSDNPSVTPRTIRFVVTDGDGGTSTAVTETLNVTAINDAPTITAIGNPSTILEDATQQVVNFSGVSAGGGESQTISITATSSNTLLIPHPAVNYVSGNASGALVYTPVADASGSATITVTVQDSGGTANGGINEVVVTFLVGVTAVNDAPTLTAISNPPAFLEDSGLQTVNLSGVSAGPGESQTLLITAQSSNTSLIPHPDVTYVSGNATGSLSFTPVQDASGTATITVTVQDNGGTANGGVNQRIRTFTVSITQVNDPPTLAAISDPVPLLEDTAEEQLIDLAGISAGADEVQNLSITAVSSNPSVVPHPAVGYVSNNANGVLTYAVPPNAHGSALITVTVQDSGGTTNGGVNQFVRTFTVSVTPVNDEPTLATIPNPAPIVQNDPQQTILLSGISAGPLETQQLSLSAVSSNPGLIPHPAVSYTSASASGSLSYTPVTGASGTAQITVTVTDDGGTANGGINTHTETFTVVVWAPVSITTPPQSITLNPGGAVHLSVAATGTAPLTYQWRRNSVAIPNATNAFYDIDPVAESDEDLYDVIVTNVVGPKTSTAAFVSVNDPVVITSEPLSLVVNENAAASLSVAATGTAPLAFQWFKNNGSIPTAQTATLNFPSAQISDEGLYHVIVSNVVGPKSSAAAQVTVLRGAARIVRHPVPQIAMLDTAVVFSVKAGGTAPFQYQWLKNGKKLAGATGSELSIAAAQAADAGTYSVQVKNSTGSAVSDPAVLTLVSAAAFNFTTLAGLPGQPGSTIGIGSNARLFLPEQGVFDSHGNFFITDSSNHTLRKITADGVVTLFAGAVGDFGSANGSSTVARFNFPSGIAIDSADNLYVSDRGSHLIRKVTPAGIVTTLAGTPNIPGASDGIGASARFFRPWGLAVDENFQVFVADSSNQTVRKIQPDGTVSTLAGVAAAAGTADGTGTQARFSSPSALALGPGGVLYLTDEDNHTIRKITSTGIVTTFAGLGGSPGSVDGSGTLARFDHPHGITVDSGGNVFVSDTSNHTIRHITPAGRVSTIGGKADAIGSSDGLGDTARFQFPNGIVAAPEGGIYILDGLNHTLRAGALVARPQINPLSQFMLVGLGQTASFNISASGGSPLEYQWARNGRNIPGATSSLFEIPGTKLTDAASYRVTVKNQVGALGSTGIRLSVVDRSGGEVIVNEAATTSLTIKAAGDRLSYEWLKDGIPLPPASHITGITTSKLAIRKATIADAGFYVCSVRLGDQRIETSGFTLRVRVKPVVAAFVPDSWTVSGTVTDAITVVDTSVLNAATTYSVAGLPKGMTFNTRTGQLGGKPDKAGTYTLTITATNAAGRGTARIVVITVSPIPANALGVASGLVDRSTTLSAPLPSQTLLGLGGSFNINVTSTGRFTGSLKLENKPYPLSARLDTHGPAGNPTASLQIKRGTGIPELTLSFTINASTGELTGTLTDGITTPAVALHGWHNPWNATQNPATSLAGIYTAALSIANPALHGSPTVPQGSGHGTLTLSTAGLASWSGVLADGTVTTLSTTLGPNGEVPLHWTLYNGTGAACGWVKASTGASAAAFGDNLLDTLLDEAQPLPENQPMFDWNKRPPPPGTSTLSYASGFALHKLAITGGAYLPPAAGQIVLGLPNSPGNARLTFSDGGIESALTYLNASGGGPAFSLSNKAFQITAQHKALFSPNPAAITLTIKPATGALFGSFTLSGDPDPTDHTGPVSPLSRKVDFSGVLVPRIGAGVGQFQLPELPSDGPPKTTLKTSPRWSGKVLLQPAP